jgi:ribosomal protein L11 methyltransferase
MSWLAVRITVKADRAEALSDALMALGAMSVSLEDANADSGDETPIFGEPNLPDAGLWDRCTIVALLHEHEDAPALLRDAANHCGLNVLPPYSLETIPEQDWVRLTQAQFEPIPISSRLWIVPTWHPTPDESALNVRLDPGLAFGTGSHPTTRLCLQWLDDHIQGGESVLDYGCGSGILAIAAKRLGAGEVWGVDLDPHAVQTARDNAVMNGVDISFFIPAQASATPAEVVVANILTNPLIALAPLLAGRTLSAGHIVLSGILERQAEDVMKVYGQWFDLDVPSHLDGWVRVSGIKR